MTSHHGVTNNPPKMPKDSGGDTSLRTAKQVFDDFENSGPPFNGVQAKWQYEAIRNYLLPKLEQICQEIAREAYDRGYNTGWVKANRNNDGKRFTTTASELRAIANRFDGYASELTQQPPEGGEHDT